MKKKKLFFGLDLKFQTIFDLAAREEQQIKQKSSICKIDNLGINWHDFATKHVSVDNLDISIVVFAT